MQKRFMCIMKGMAALLMAGWLAACDNEKPEDWNNPECRAVLEKAIEEGNLLNRVTVENGIYTFHFETGTVEVPATDILNVREEADNWRTVVTFANRSDFYIPSLGKSLDKFIKEVTLNPGDYSPLAASVEMFLPAKGRMQVVVRGKEGTAGTVSHLFRSGEYKQTVPVLGLYAGYNNQVDLIFTDMEGNERGRSRIEIPTQPLDMNSFPTFFVKTAQPDRMEPGVTLVNYPGESEMDTSCPYMVDAEGEIRWILRLDKSPELTKLGAQIGLHRMKNGNFLTGDANHGRVVEIDVFGNLANEWDLSALGYAFHHEAAEASDGHFLVTVSKSAARLTNGKPRMNDHIIELDPQSGTVVKEWDLATMLDTARYEVDAGGAGFGQTAGNWAHNNSITEYKGAYLACVRFQGVIKFTRSGSLSWIIAPHKNWREEYKKFLLTPLDKSGQPITDPEVLSGDASCDDFDWTWGPHTPVAMPNGNVLVFDNGYYRNYIPRTVFEDGTYSRVVEYRVNESQKTVQQVWEYGKERERSCYSPALSGVQYLPETGHILFCPGLGNILTNGKYGGRIVEIEPTTKEIIYELEIAAPSMTAFHRATRMSLYPENW